jgi:hypothetical protein
VKEIPMLDPVYTRALDLAGPEQKWLTELHESMKRMLSIHIF